MPGYLPENIKLMGKPNGDRHGSIQSMQVHDATHIRISYKGMDVILLIPPR
jgi:hypothetical protein